MLRKEAKKITKRPQRRMKNLYRKRNLPNHCLDNKPIYELRKLFQNPPMPQSKRLKKT